MSSTTKSTETIRVTADARGCPICGSAEFAPVCEVHGFRYVSCAGCSSVRQFPYPSAADISSFYANYYGKKSTERGYLSADAFAGFQNDKQMTFSDLGLAGDAFAQSAGDGAQLARRGGVALQGGLGGNTLEWLVRCDWAVVVAVRIKR